MHPEFVVSRSYQQRNATINLHLNLMNLIEEVYKKEYLSIISILLARFGINSKQQIEDSVQEAFISLLLQNNSKIDNIKA
jgi:hypothetical protein